MTAILKKKIPVLVANHPQEKCHHYVALIESPFQKEKRCNTQAFCENMNVSQKHMKCVLQKPYSEVLLN